MVRQYNKFYLNAQQFFVIFMYIVFSCDLYGGEGRFCHVKCNTLHDPCFSFFISVC